MNTLSYSSKPLLFDVSLYGLSRGHRYLVGTTFHVQETNNRTLVYYFFLTHSILAGVGVDLEEIMEEATAAKSCRNTRFHPSRVMRYTLM